MDAEKIQKRHVAILIPHYTEGEELYAFLQKRSDTAKRSPGLFGFWGGGLEAGESPEQALLREVYEELGIQIKDHAYFSHYEFYGSIFDVYTLSVKKDFVDKLKIGEGEYGKFFSESEVEDEPKLSRPDKLILSNLFGKMKRNNPYGSAK